MYSIRVLVFAVFMLFALLAGAPTASPDTTSTALPHGLWAQKQQAAAVNPCTTVVIAQSSLADSFAVEFYKGLLEEQRSANARTFTILSWILAFAMAVNIGIIVYVFRAAEGKLRNELRRVRSETKQYADTVRSDTQTFANATSQTLTGQILILQFHLLPRGQARTMEDYLLVAKAFSYHVAAVDYLMRISVASQDVRSLYLENFQAIIAGLSIVRSRNMWQVAVETLRRDIGNIRNFDIWKKDSEFISALDEVEKGMNDADKPSPLDEVKTP